MKKIIQPIQHRKSKTLTAIPTEFLNTPSSTPPRTPPHDISRSCTQTKSTTPTLSSESNQYECDKCNTKYNANQQMKFILHYEKHLIEISKNNYIIPEVVPTIVPIKEKISSMTNTIVYNGNVIRGGSKIILIQGINITVITNLRTYLVLVLLFNNHTENFHVETPFLILDKKIIDDEYGMNQTMPLTVNFVRQGSYKRKLSLTPSEPPKTSIKHVIDKLIITTNATSAFIDIPIMYKSTVSFEELTKYIDDLNKEQFKKKVSFNKLLQSLNDEINDSLQDIKISKTTAHNILIGKIIDAWDPRRYAVKVIVRNIRKYTLKKKF